VVINKKLLLNMIITAAIALIILSGFVIFCSKSIISNMLLNKCKEQLMLIRDFKKQELENFFTNIKNNLELLTQDQMLQHSFKEFKVAYDQTAIACLDQMKTHNPDPAINQHYNNISKQYKEYFAADKNKVDFTVFLQNLNQHSINLQTKYMANGVSDFEIAEYNNIHNKYHDYFRKITTDFKYNDLLLVDFTGNVIYSTKKNIDFASSLTTGAFSGSEIASIFNLVKYSEDYQNKSAISNFSEYLPNYQEPIVFVANKIPNVGVVIISVGVNAVNSLLTLPKKITKTNAYLVDQELRLINQNNFGKLVHTVAAREASANKKGFIESIGKDQVTNISYYTPIEGLALSLIVESPKNVILQNLSKSLTNMFYFTAAIIPVLLFFVYTICCLSLEKAHDKLTKISEFMQVVVAKKDLRSRISTSNQDNLNNMASVLNNMLSWFQNTLEQVGAKIQQFVSRHNNLLGNITDVSSKVAQDQSLLAAAKKSTVQLALSSSELQQGYKEYNEAIKNHQKACSGLNDLNIQVNQKQNIADLTNTIEYIYSICNLADMLSLQVSLEANKSNKQQSSNFVILSKEIKKMTSSLKSQLMTIKSSFDSYSSEYSAIRDFVYEFSCKLKPINNTINKLMVAQQNLLSSNSSYKETVNKLQENLSNLANKYHAVRDQLTNIVDSNSRLNPELKIDDYYPLKIVEDNSN
jgi:methyl-accepting chemotaxis protein